MNSRGGWKKYQKLIVVGFGIVGGLGKIESFNSRGGGFFLSFSNHKTELRTILYAVKAR